MFKRMSRLPKPALVISVIALIVAVGGGTFAIAGGGDNHIKKIADKEIKKKAPKLSVKKAKTAKEADHATAADSATNADSATKADSATTAGTANAAFNGFHNSGIAMPNSLGAGANPIATLAVTKPGTYIILATLQGNQQGTVGDLAQCVLAAGGNSDESDVNVPATGSHEAQMAMQTTHTFSAAGNATLSCTDLGNTNSNIQAQNIRITAIQVATLTSSGI